ncbi:keratin-associated protein 16-1-like [Centrocercus urophasianus]|uniref:keratin-associated protein 16-1-like n=1 Tax=Centrocercus urophasianus TaxID=9002 RepID=UPI001C649CDE|nr:keratin-associated protein 16-1-like [Centrocercus urophasianus]
MSEPCEQSCLPPPSCVGTAVPTDLCTSCSIAAHPDTCSEQNACPCPEQTLGVDLCQAVPSCPDVCSPTCPPPTVPAPEDICDPCTSQCVTTCVCPAGDPCDLQQCQAETGILLQSSTSPAAACAPEKVGTCVETFPHQHAVSPCSPETDEICVETIPAQHPVSSMKICTPEAAGTGVETCPSQHGITPVELCILKTTGTCVETPPLQHPEPLCTIEVLEACTETTPTICIEDPSCPQPAIASHPEQCPLPCVDPCTAQTSVCPEPCSSAATQGPGSASSPRAPFRLNTRTAAIVERCLARCQSWLRGTK